MTTRDFLLRNHIPLTEWNGSYLTEHAYREGTEDLSEVKSTMIPLFQVERKDERDTFDTVMLNLEYDGDASRVSLALDTGGWMTNVFDAPYRQDMSYEEMAFILQEPLMELVHAREQEHNSQLLGGWDSKTAEEQKEDIDRTAETLHQKYPRIDLVMGEGNPDDPYITGALMLFPHGEPDAAFDQEVRESGLSTIDDINGLEPGLYVDTRENRRLCLQAIREHPREAGIQSFATSDYIDYWQNVYPEWSPKPQPFPPSIAKEESQETLVNQQEDASMANKTQRTDATAQEDADGIVFTEQLARQYFLTGHNDYARIEVAGSAYLYDTSCPAYENDASASYFDAKKIGQRLPHITEDELPNLTWGDIPSSKLVFPRRLDAPSESDIAEFGLVLDWDSIYDTEHPFVEGEEEAREAYLPSLHGLLNYALCDETAWEHMRETIQKELLPLDRENSTYADHDTHYFWLADYTEPDEFCGYITVRDNQVDAEDASRVQYLNFKPGIACIGENGSVALTWDVFDSEFTDAQGNHYTPDETDALWWQEGQRFSIPLEEFMRMTYPEFQQRFEEGVAKFFTYAMEHSNFGERHPLLADVMQNELASQQSIFMLSSKQEQNMAFQKETATEAYQRASQPLRDAYGKDTVLFTSFPREIIKNLANTYLQNRDLIGFCESIYQVYPDHGKPIPKEALERFSHFLQDDLSLPQVPETPSAFADFSQAARDIDWDNPVILGKIDTWMHTAADAIKADVDIENHLLFSSMSDIPDQMQRHGIDYDQDFLFYNRDTGESVVVNGEETSAWDMVDHLGMPDTVRIRYEDGKPYLRASAVRSGETEETSYYLIPSDRLRDACEELPEVREILQTDERFHHGSLKLPSQKTLQQAAEQFETSAATYQSRMMEAGKTRTEANKAMLTILQKINEKSKAQGIEH